MMKLELINDDCMNVMRDYPDNYFDLAIVDPPYFNAAKSRIEQETKQVDMFNN